MKYACNLVLQTQCTKYIIDLVLGGNKMHQAHHSRKFWGLWRFMATSKL